MKGVARGYLVHIVTFADDNIISLCCLDRVLIVSTLFNKEMTGYVSASFWEKRYRNTWEILTKKVEVSIKSAQIIDQRVTVTNRLIMNPILHCTFLPFCLDFGKVWKRGKVNLNQRRSIFFSGTGHITAIYLSQDWIHDIQSD